LIARASAFHGAWMARSGLDS